MNTSFPAGKSVHRANVVERWRELDAGKLARVIAIVNEQALPLKQRHHEQINRVLNQPGLNTGAKIEALWQAVDEIGALAAPYSACRKGCSHCCHIPVLLPAQEAALIGHRIGVAPAKVTGVTAKDAVRSGYDNPCPFLKDDACSIYESRPLACRQQVNMDSDALLCELVGDEATKVPYLNLMDYNTALVYITSVSWTRRGHHARSGRPALRERFTMPDVGDIREFFPNGNANQKDDR
ncbi:YkgJ family cysteine cluster protein [Paraburkholderia sp. 35.1]|uniref:YkgJ family cysteine cluster protein n=1 Tax=Paraburkholderia sp. 35.1 TaxID=2991058 RepID=UPI003D1B32C1